ncbi:MAG: HAD hydrolase-like protein, partial [Bacteroidota bacterium]
IEKAIAKFNIDTEYSWLVGDSERDIQAGHRMHLQTALVASNVQPTAATWVVESLYAFSQRLLQ